MEKFRPNSFLITQGAQDDCTVIRMFIWIKMDIYGHNKSYITVCWMGMKYPFYWDKEETNSEILIKFE